MKREAPTVSVCIPVYNGEKYLASAIESVLKQGYKDYELLIVDDCSNDSSPEIVESFRKRSTDIEYYTNSRNLGITKNWNRCIELARGKYILILHQDDELLSDAVELEVKVLNEHPEVGVVFGNAEVIYLPQGHKFTYPGWDVSFKIKGHDFAAHLLSHENCIYCPTVMMRKESFEKYGLFDPFFEISEDYEMWLRLALQGVDFAFLPSVIAKYRYHQTNTSKRVIIQGHNIKEVYRILELHGSRTEEIFGEESTELLERFRQKFAYLCLGYALNLVYNGYSTMAKKQLKSAIDIYPKYRKSLIVNSLNVLSSLGFVGRLCVMFIEGLLRWTKLWKFFDEAIYSHKLDLPENRTGVP